MKWKGINVYKEYSITLYCHRNSVAGSTINTERNAIRLIRLYKARRDAKGLETSKAEIRKFIGYDKKKPIYEVIKTINFLRS